MSTGYWGLLLALPGIAAAATDTTIHTAADEMVVTATKTALPAVEVPASLSVLYGEDLEAQRVEEISQLAARTPGLVFQPWGQSGTNPARDARPERQCDRLLLLRITDRRRCAAADQSGV